MVYDDVINRCDVMALQRSTHASCNMIRSIFQCLRRHACLCRGPLQLLEQPMHLSAVAAVSVCTAERRVHSQFPCSNWRTPSAVTVDTNCIAVQRRFHCSPHSRGLEEFFPRTDDIVEEGEQTGKCACYSTKLVRPLLLVYMFLVRDFPH